MSALASIGVLLCVLLAAGFAASIGPALRHDAHLLHTPGTCPECEES